MFLLDLYSLLCYNDLRQSKFFPLKRSVNPNIFREFSIRGIANQDLPDDVVTVIGRAIGLFFGQRDAQTIVVGRDVRNSSPRISQALIAGLLQTGIDVTDVGLVPSPVHNFATDLYNADAGVMITASHNPAEYNGLKIRTQDRSLHGDEVQEIYRLALAEQANVAEATPEAQAKRADPLPVYVERLKALSDLANAALSHPLKIVVDGGNGTNGQIVANLLSDLGVTITKLYCEPDGDFPGRGPDPTSDTGAEALSNWVQREQADLGLAYDGDGDRLALVDESGQRVFGDQIMMILARDILRQSPAKIVYEILCTQALADDIAAHGGEPIVTPSGYAFVHRAVQESGAAMGGELSGHLFFDEPGFRFDDSILATIKLLNVIIRMQGPLSTLVADLPAYHSSPQFRVSCPDSAKAEVVASVKQQFEKDYHVETVDGARIHFPEGWAMVRQSNTQPVISMRFEARSPEQLEAIQTRVQTLVEAEIKRHTGE